MTLEQKLISEALTSKESLLHIIIKPKIDKLKKWIERRELQHQLDPDVLSKILSDYLEGLSAKVSSISSICFPQKKFDINTAYEPLFIEPKSINPSYNASCNDEEKTKLTIDHILNNLDSSFLLIDSAGMGKSTFSKYLVTQLLYKSNRIPILLELRKSKCGTSLIDIIANELDPLRSMFSRELFYELIENGRFVIILDGFDEVEFDHQNEIAEQINELSLKGMKNTIIVTTRPQELMPDIINAELYKFSSFTKTQAKNLINRLDNVSKLDIGKRLIQELDSAPENFLQNPLLVSLLYSTFGANNTIADRISTFYNEIYDALYKGHDLINKNGFKRQKSSNLDFEEFRIILRALCFKMMIMRKPSFSSASEAHQFINYASTLSKVKIKSAELYLHDLLNAVPLMQKEGSEFKFLHKTIIEYFAAEFIVYQPNSEIILNSMFESNSFESFYKVFDFVSELSETTYDRVVTLKYANDVCDKFDLDTIEKAILWTVDYLFDIKIGLFPVSKYKDESGMADFNLIHYSLMKDKSFVQSSLKFFYCPVNHDKNNYYLFFAISNKDVKLHGVGWSKVCEAFERSRYYSANIEKELFDLLGIESWMKLEGNIEELSKFNSILGVVSRYSGGIFHTTGISEGYLSQKKIKQFLQSVQAQSELEDELTSILGI